MSTMELARRLGVTRARVGQLEQAEVRGSIPLSSLERAAAALNCRVCYALVPFQSLEQMVWQQALGKAAWVRALAAGHPRSDPEEESRPSIPADELSAQIEALAHHLVDRRGLWSGELGPPPTEVP
jgi:predicted DNA-binding mobile mystery protein A